ncbi:glutaredoxin 2 [Seminavis robusta]|uniref:Glutaredoxin 2 n=1 Tax=Seminavis robusta TaxID=568900 RepID=A0A9N8HCG8_9STRA|nr:glutaredoxin 2 [Seminavis robusta]|eukprot:Sro318_g116020.1 glutaredoxin 2 (244) ;mRNA; f:63476-64207
MIDQDVEYTFHCYDHCPFGNRVAFLMDHFGIKYKKVVYGYGSGALPKECEGEGYDGDLNPRKLTGKKQLPVLEGPGVPCAPGAVGMPESLEICSFLIGRHQLVVPCATGRADVKELTDYLLDKKVMNPLTLVKLTKMPVADWADKRDVSYHVWKHKKKGDILSYENDEDAAAIKTLNAKLAEIPAMLKGDKCLNSWGFGMDDVLFLPWLRRLTCIKGVEFPSEVSEYMSTVGAQVEDYAKHAV